MSEETVKHFEAVYEKMCEDLKGRHIRYVNQNFALRGLELARRQIHKEGDTEVDYAMALLERAYDLLTAKNREEAKEMYAMSSFVRKFMRQVEDETGYELDPAKHNEAMDARDNPRKLPPLMI